LLQDLDLTPALELLRLQRQERLPMQQLPGLLHLLRRQRPLFLKVQASKPI
jgi:hypothetical protein